MIDYKLITGQLKALVDDDHYFIPVLSNASALLYDSLPDLNWAGFYLVRDNQLVLGPFQGKVACIHIAKGRGVCGTAWATGETQMIDNVHEFPGHIACDGASNSEIVIPIHNKNTAEIVGVLDIDSPSLARFKEEDREGLETFVKALEDVLEWN